MMQPPARDVRPATAYPLSALAACMTRAYAGSPVDVRMDAWQLEAWARERDVDFAASRVLAGADGAPAGLALVGRRGANGYLATLGVEPAHRGAGAARALLDAVTDALRTLGVTRMTLEVLEENATARRLYERAGWTATRTMPCHRARALVGGNTDVKRVPLADARKRAQAFGTEVPNAWPNAWRTALRAQAHGYAHPAAGVAVAKATRTGLHVFNVTGPDPARVLDGVAALHAGERASFLNVPSARVADALASRGWERFAVQVEMTRAL